MRFDSKYDNRYDEADELSDHLSDQLSFQDRANRRLIGGVLVSVALHLLALSLQFGIPGLDLPSFEAPWKERRTALERMQVTIATPAPKALPVPPTPAVTIPELFKLPEPVLPPPVPKSLSPATENHLTLIAPLPLPKPKPINERDQAVLLSRTSKKRAKTQAKLIPLEPQANTVLPPLAKSTPVIAQDERKDDAFFVPVAKPETALQTQKEIKEVGDNKDEIPEDAIIDKDAEIKRLEEQKRLEQLEKTKLEEKRQQVLQQEREEKQRQLDKQRERELAQERELQEKNRKAAQELAQKLAQQTAQRERELALEEIQRETKRQELLSQETARQEEQRRQAEQQRQHQLALAQEAQKQVLLAQAQRQQQAKEESEKQRALEIAERKRQEEVLAQKVIAQQLAERKIAEKRLLEQKLEEQKLAEQKLEEQKLAEQKLEEQKLAEQKLAEQKLAEQKLAEQKLAEQKLAEQKLAEQKLAEQKLAEQKLAEQKLAEAAKRAETERANAARLAPTGNGTGNATGTSSIDQAALPNRGDLASRLREQARSGDLFKSTSSAQNNDTRARRRSFLGAYDREVPLRMYLDSVKHKLERNGNLIYEKRSLSNVENNVLVNMKIRSDGSIEEVIVIRSSGSRAIDDRARNIVLANAPFSVFPMALAAKYDVIEIQQVWNFGDKLRILDELP